MSNITVAEFANELQRSVGTLLEQLKAAGVQKNSGGDFLTESDKQKLLGHLKASHGTAPTFTVSMVEVGSMAARWHHGMRIYLHPTLHT